MRDVSVPAEELPSLTGVGLQGEVEAILACLAAAGQSVDFAEAMVLSGAAFSTYFYTPDHHPNVTLGPDPEHKSAPWALRYAWSSLRSNNYGCLEALSYDYGAELKHVGPVGRVQAAQALKFELAEGRPVVLIEESPLFHSLDGNGTSVPDRPGTAESRPKIVHRYHVETGPLAFYIGLVGAEQFELTEADKVQLLIVRRREKLDYHPGVGSRLLSVLKWVVHHGRASKELVHETERFYAAGLGAFDALASFVTVHLPAELDDPKGLTTDSAPGEMRRFTATVLGEWASRRATIASFLGGDVMGRLDGFPSSEVGALADRYQACADALRSAASFCESMDVASSSDRDTLADAVRSARVKEVLSLDALDALLSSRG